MKLFSFPNAAGQVICHTANCTEYIKHQAKSSLLIPRNKKAYKAHEAMKKAKNERKDGNESVGQTAGNTSAAAAAQQAVFDSPQFKHIAGTSPHR